MKNVYKVDKYIDERDAIKLKSHEITQKPKTAIESVLLFTALLIIYFIVQLFGNGTWEIPIAAIALVAIIYILWRYGYKRIWMNYRKASKDSISYTAIIYPHDHTILGISNNKIDTNIKYLWLLNFEITNSGKGLTLFDYSNLKLKIATDTDNVIEINCPNIKMTVEIASALDTLMLNDRALQVDWYKNQSVHKNLGFAPSFEMIARLASDFPDKDIMKQINELDKIIAEAQNLSKTPSFETISKLEVIFPGKNILELITELDKVINKVKEKTSDNIERFLDLLVMRSKYTKKKAEAEADAERIKAEADAIINFVMDTEDPAEVLSDKEIKTPTKADKKAKAEAKQKAKADKQAKAEAKAEAKQKAKADKQAKAEAKARYNAIAQKQVEAEAEARVTVLRYYDIQISWYRMQLANGANTNPYASDRVYSGARFKVYYAGI